MRFMKYTVSVLLIIVLLCLSACGQTPAAVPSQTVAPGPTLPPDVVTTEPQQTEESDEPILEPLAFDPEKAEYLGTINTEIYGPLIVYYQDLRIVIFDVDGFQRFTLYAQSYMPFYNGTPVQLTARDVNFDGYTDFYLLYSRGNLNSYYFFWIWNMEKRTFEYFLPLSSIPSPEIDGYTRRIISSDQTALDTVIITNYVWAEGQIVPVSHEEKTLDPENMYHDPFAPEEVDGTVMVQDGLLLSSVVLRLNDPTTSDWVYKIDDERIVKLFSNSVDSSSHTRRFTFRGGLPGTTTVVFRYARGWDAPFLTQRILNITVNRNYTLTIKVMQ